jgi:hypothetical protein
MRLTLFYAIAGFRWLKTIDRKKIELGRPHVCEPAKTKLAFFWQHKFQASGLWTQTSQEV